MRSLYEECPIAPFESRCPLLRSLLVTKTVTLASCFVAMPFTIVICVALSCVLNRRSNLHIWRHGWRVSHCGCRTPVLGLPWRHSFSVMAYIHPSIFSIHPSSPRESSHVHHSTYSGSPQFPMTELSGAEIQPTCDDLQPHRNGLQPKSFSLLVASCY